MTRQEFYNKYGQVLVEFSSYYKYEFTYTGTTDDGLVVTLGVGGNSNEIYRHEVVPGVKEPAQNLWPYRGEVHKDGQLIDYFYDH